MRLRGLPVERVEDAMRTRHYVPLTALLLLVLSLTTTVGCASVNSQMQSWVGHHQAELIASWGPPARTAADGNGGTILIYYQYRDFGQTRGKVYSDGSYTAPRENGYVAQRMFYVNPDGVIYSWRWQGL
jgi:hypothetical protein